MLSEDTTQSTTPVQQTAMGQAQQHLLPKQANMRIGSVNNELDFAKRNYIIKMRQATANSAHIIFEDGSLNFKYFNVKKGHYWSPEENEKLIHGVLKFGPTDFKQIRKVCFEEQWSETEIRLRICRLFKCYDLTMYQDRAFENREQIMECARVNKQEAVASKKNVGGILYNPPAEADDGIMSSFFN